MEETRLENRIKELREQLATEKLVSKRIKSYYQEKTSHLWNEQENQ